MNTRDKKRVIKQIEKCYSCAFFCPETMLVDEQRKIFCSSADLTITEKIPVKGVGLELGFVVGDGIILTLEGCERTSQVKNRVLVDQEQLEEYVKGKDIVVDGSGYVIVYYGEEIIGCGKIVEGVIKNKTPKERSLKLSEAMP